MELVSGERDELLVRGDLSLANLHDLRNALLIEFGKSGHLALDLSGVESCDAASLQLLCSLKRRGEPRDWPVGVTAISPAILRQMASIGLAAADLPSAMDRKRDDEGVECQATR